MKQMTGEELVENIKKDPSWCLGVKEQLKITTCADLTNSKITHLSPLLHFCGEWSPPHQKSIKKTTNLSAIFRNCKNLKEICGTFHGYIDCTNSAVEVTDKIKVIGNKVGMSAYFIKCKNLKVLKGHYEGSIDLEGSGVERIEAKVIITKKPNNNSLTPRKSLHQNRNRNRNRKFYLENCQNLIPDEKYIKDLNDYKIDTKFIKKCELMKLRKELNRLTPSLNI